MLNRWINAAALCLVALCGANAWGAEPVSVLYAGSLVHLMERGIGPAFEKETGIGFRGYAGGSNKLASEIKGKLRRGDVFISASPKVNESLSGTANGDWVRWYASFAQSPLTIGYNPKSRFAASLKTLRWDKALTQPGIRIGRTDPKLDPKGAFTVQLLNEAQKVYNDPTLSQRMLGDPEDATQVLPEETLVGRLQAGQLDAGFFYSTETADLKIPSLPLPKEFDIKASYTITLLGNAPNQAGAERFVEFLLSAKGRALLEAAGVEVLTPTVHGDAQAIPPALQGLLHAGSSPAK
jgi:molybdate/tungstate transport system substrate-binding protein